jgi:hypothetical protein
MTDSIIRIYATGKKARDTVGKLKEAGFGDDRVVLVAPAGEGADAASAVASALKAGSAIAADADEYAEALQKGRSLVVVRPPFGTALEATRILESTGPLDPGGLHPPVRRPPPEPEPGAPLSSLLYIPILLRNQPAPFSSLFGIPTLARGLSIFSSLFRPLTRPDFFASSKLGMGTPLGRSEPAPLSSRVGLKTLTDKAAPLSSATGMPVLIDKAAPLSSAVGLPTLGGGAAPLSSLFRIPLLTKERR